MPTAADEALMANPLAATPWQRNEKRKPTPGERTYEHVLNDARETSHKGIKEVINSKRMTATFDHENAMKQYRYWNATNVPDDIHEVRTSPTGILSHHDSALSPPRLSRTSATQMHLPSALILPPPSPAESIHYPWEQETPKASGPSTPPIGPVPRSQYTDPSPSLWNMGRWPGFTGPNAPPNSTAPNAPASFTAPPNSEGMYDMLQNIKDEDAAPHLQGRPYTPSLWVPLPPPKEPWVRPATSDVTGRPRIRTVLRPRPGFPGALAIAPAGYQAMIAECKASYTADLPPVVAPGRVRPPSQSVIERPMSRRTSVSVVSELVLSLPNDIVDIGERSSCPPAFTRRASITPLLTPRTITPEMQIHASPDSDEPGTPEPEGEPFPKASEDSTPSTPTLPPLMSPKQPPTVKSTASTIQAAKVWVGTRGKVLNGKVIP